jgi:hypothetical protein
MPSTDQTISVPTRRELDSLESRRRLRFMKDLPDDDITLDRWNDRALAR